MILALELIPWAFCVIYSTDAKMTNSVFENNAYFTVCLNFDLNSVLKEFHVN